MYVQVLDLLKSTDSHGPDMEDLNHWVNMAHGQRDSPGGQAVPVNHGASTSGTAGGASVARSDEISDVGDD